VTWSGDLRTVSNGINPALAVDGVGHIGFLYQTLTGGNTWETHIEISTNAFATAPSPIVLATVPSATPVATFHPYLGDYIYLTAISQTFYGIFSTANTPNTAHFPNGVTYQRNANFTTNTLLNVDNATPVAVSIDPFFFSVSELNFPPISPIAIKPIVVSPPVKPIVVTPPVKPITILPPVKPITIAPPVKPIAVQPVKPIAVEPIKPITVQPIKPITVQPIEPIEPVKPE
jgi:hypothetical protein